MSNITRSLSLVGKTESETGLRVAFASDDGKNVNQHFGTAKSIVIYTVGPGSATFFSVAEFAEIEGEDADDKLAVKLSYLSGCVAVYCRACGASAIRQLLEMEIQPLKVLEDVSIKTLIKAFQKELQNGPAHWLARAIVRQNGARGHEYELQK